MADTTQPEAASTNPVPPPNATIDPSFYTWTTLFKSLIGNATNEEIKSYRQQRDLLHEESDCKRCEENKDWLFQHSPIITFLRTQIRDLGGENADINSKNVRCRRCTTDQTGGFDSNYGILICANETRRRKVLEDTMAHEMIHAYDHVRFKVDRWNMKHQACTEIRASVLSGECRFGREVLGRKQWKITQQLQECVRRRATLSLMNRPEIKDDVHAAKIVNEVWESCFNDTRPFDEIYK